MSDIFYTFNFEKVGCILLAGSGPTLLSWESDLSLIWSGMILFSMVLLF